MHGEKHIELSDIRNRLDSIQEALRQKETIDKGQIVGELDIFSAAISQRIQENLERLDPLLQRIKYIKDRVISLTYSPEILVTEDINTPVLDYFPKSETLLAPKIVRKISSQVSTPLKLFTQVPPFLSVPKKLEAPRFPYRFILEKDSISYTFEIGDVEGYDFCVLKVGGEVITKPFIFNTIDRKQFFEIISGEVTSLNASLRIKLEQNTPLSLQRDNGKIRLYIKSSLPTVQKKVEEMENGYNILVSGKRVIVTNIPAQGKGDYKASISIKGDTELVAYITEKLYLVLDELIKRRESGEFYTYEALSTIIARLEEKFGEIGVHSPFESQRNTTTS